MYDNYERRNWALDLRGCEPTLGRNSNQIPEAYITYQELIEHIGSNPSLAQLLSQFNELTNKVQHCCNQDVFGRRVKMNELAKNIGSMFLEANFDYKRRRGIQTNQAVLSLYEVQAVTPDEEWAEALMERIGLTAWSQAVRGEMLTSGQYTLQLSNGRTLNEAQYAALADDNALYAALGLRLLYNVPVFELVSANGANSPAVLTAPGNTVSIAGDTPFTFTYNGAGGMFDSTFRLNGVDILGGPSDLLPGNFVDGQVLALRGGNFAGQPVPGTLLVVLGNGEVISNGITLTA